MGKVFSPEVELENCKKLVEVKKRDLEFAKKKLASDKADVNWKTMHRSSCIINGKKGYFTYSEQAVAQCQRNLDEAKRALEVAKEKVKRCKKK